MRRNESNIKITRDPIDESSIETLDILRADYAGKYKIHLWFSDGKDHIVDFTPFLKNARNPMTTKYRDMKKFRQFRLDYGNLQWNDYEMCFTTEDLYNNDISMELNSDDRLKPGKMTTRMGITRNR